MITDCCSKQVCDVNISDCLVYSSVRGGGSGTSFSLILRGHALRRWIIFELTQIDRHLPGVLEKKTVANIKWAHFSQGLDSSCKPPTPPREDRWDLAYFENEKKKNKDSLGLRHSRKRIQKGESCAIPKPRAKKNKII